MIDANALVSGMLLPSANEALGGELLNRITLKV